MQDKYKMIRLIAGISIVSAWVICIFFLALTFIILFGGGGPDSPRYMSIVTFFIGVYNFFILFALGKILYLQVEILDAVSDKGQLQLRTGVSINKT